MGRLVGVEAASAHHPPARPRDEGRKPAHEIGLGQEEMRRVRAEGERVPEHREEPGERAEPPAAGAHGMDGDAARDEHLRHRPARAQRHDTDPSAAHGERGQHRGEMPLRSAKAERDDDDEKPEAGRQLSHPTAQACGSSGMGWVAPDHPSAARVASMIRSCVAASR
jgi:hypothetical protein